MATRCAHRPAPTTQRYPIPCPDPREWQRDCQQEAYVAIALQAEQYRCPDPPPADPTRHQILWLANQAYNALRQFWRQEAKYYQHTVPMLVQDEAGEEQELEWVDEAAEAKVLDRFFCEQLLERLLLGLEAVDWAIFDGFSGGALSGRDCARVRYQSASSEQAFAEDSAFGAWDFGGMGVKVVIIFAAELFVLLRAAA